VNARLCCDIDGRFALRANGVNVHSDRDSLRQDGCYRSNAKVDLEDVDTKATTSVTTGSDGGYTFPSVRPGNYSITVSSKGFRQSVVSSVRVAIGKIGPG